MVGVSYIMLIAICCLGSYANSAEDFEKCSSLDDYVDCADSNLASIPNNIPKWTARLNLNNNLIRKLEGEGWTNLTQLWELKLNKNKIQHIHKDTFEHMKQLKMLEMNRNQLEHVEPLSFQSLEHVLVLKLKRNRIQNLGDGSFFGLKKIRSLSLDYNSVQFITKSWLYGLDNLKLLSMSNNVIQSIDNDAWEFCKGLVELDLSHNRMRSINKDTFKDLYDLQKLSLNNNNISLIEESSFSNTPNLKYLQLSENKISWTIEDANGVFRGLINLIKFYLASNDIKSISKNAFTGLNNVSYLNLNNNNITSIQRNAFSDMPLLDDIVMNTSSLLCDCNLRWFYDYLRIKRFQVVTVCAYPEWFRGQPLLLVPINNFTCDYLPKPRLIEEPDMEIMASKGENVSLTCKAVSTSTSLMTFQWKKDNIELLNAVVSGMVTTLDLKSTESISILNITEVQHSDAGKYQCVVSNGFGSTYSQKSSISVLIRPIFKKTPSNITVQAGTTARLDCSATGEPQPEIAWQKDGGNDFPAARERRMQVMPADDVFFIINAKLSDMGVYSCTAHNAAGIIVANATLSIEEKPSFVKPMEDKEVTAGESVVIQCMASGAPKPTIQWLKDGIPIAATERHFFTAEEQLMIIVDTILSDGGIYTCQLNNSLGTETTYSTLIVKPVLMTDSDMFGIIIITIVCCAVFTSIVWVVIIYQTRRALALPNTSIQPPEPTILDFADKPVQFGDNTSELSSCKDSGTGDSKRSNDDLLPGDEYTLIINGGNLDNKSTTMRAASLVYLASDGNNCHTPLLHSADTPYPRSTNHERVQTTEETNASSNPNEVAEVCITLKISK